MPAVLLNDITPSQQENNPLVTGFCLDSRQIKEGELFVALPGYVADGRDYLADAQSAGAAAAVVEASDGWIVPERIDMPIVAIKGLQQELGLMASRFYDKPSAKMAVTGVTGTNGKTTVASLYAQVLNALGDRAAVMGTLGCRYGDMTVDTGMTTPEATTLQALMSQCVTLGAANFVMEVSSHGLVLGRVNEVEFDTAVFTNLSRDHLDFHSDMDSYCAAKRRLFDFPALKCAVINLDDAYGKVLLNDISLEHIISYSLADNSADVYCQNIHYGDDAIRAKIFTPWGNGNLTVPLLGDFNLSNTLAVIAGVCNGGADLAAVLLALENVEPVPGRLQKIDAKDLLVVVDYAHTPDALAKASAALSNHYQGSLWVVVGCGGDRDVGKRPMMGQIAGQVSDCLVVTSDNPRTEPPENIINDILTGVESGKPTYIEADRELAIGFAIANAGAGDCVLIAGKGHETFQYVGVDKLPFDDCQVAAIAISKRELQ